MEALRPAAAGPAALGADRLVPAVSTTALAEFVTALEIEQTGLR